MVDVHTVSIVIAASGLFIAAVNQILSNRRAEKQRQIELENRQIETFMRITDRFDVLAYADVANRKWTNFGEFVDKYGSVANPQAYRNMRARFASSE